MSTPIDLRKIEQKVFRASIQDGLTELVLGFCLAILALRAVSSAFILVYLASPLLCRPVLIALRKRFTHPRLGYVQLVEDKPREVLGGIAAITLIFIAVLTVALFLSGGFKDFGRCLNWTPSLIGVLLGGMFLSFAYKSNLVRQYVFAMISVFCGLFFSIFNFGSFVTGVSLYFLVLGILLMLSGLVLFLKFLRRCPLPAKEVSHVNAN